MLYPQELKQQGGPKRRTHWCDKLYLVTRWPQFQQRAQNSPPSRTLSLNVSTRCCHQQTTFNQCFVYARCCRLLSRHETPVLSKPIEVIHLSEDLVVLDKPCSLPVSNLIISFPGCDMLVQCLVACNQDSIGYMNLRFTNDVPSVFRPQMKLVQSQNLRTKGQSKSVQWFSPSG